MIHQIFADGLMFSHFLGNLQLRPHSVNARDQNGVPVSGNPAVETTSESPNASDHSGTSG
jgi:hypothetical protein